MAKYHAERTKGLERKTKPARVDSLIMPSVWVEPEIVIEVLADEITRSPLHTAGMQMEKQKTIKGKESRNQSGMHCGFPDLFLSEIKIKKPEDATTVDELIEMYNDAG